MMSCTQEGKPAEYVPALVWAVLQANATLVQTLLDLGADPSTRYNFDFQNRDVLKLAQSLGNVGIIRAIESARTAREKSGD